MYVSSGTPRGWITPMIPRLMNNETDIRCSTDQVSWVVSSRSIGIVVFDVLLYFTVNFVGRKVLLLVACVPSVVSWLVMYFATSCEELIVARVLESSCASILYTIPALYISEISRDEVRGTFSLAREVTEVVGDLLVTSIAPYVSHAVLAAVPAIFPAVCFAAFLWMPESPYFLLLKGRRDLAEASLRKLRGLNDVTEEFHKMQLFVDQSRSESKNPKISDLVNTSQKRRAVFICSFLVLSMIWSGTQILGEYKTLIFRMSNTSVVSADTSATLLLVVQLLTTTVTMWFVDRFGRRPLLMTSSVICAVAFTVGAVSFYYENVPGWLPLLWTAVFKIGNAVGINSMPWTISTEIFPADIKGLAMACLSLWIAVLAAVSFKLIPIFIENWGVSSVLWGSVVILLLTLLVTIFYLPETKSKPFAEIQEELLHSTSSGSIFCSRIASYELRHSPNRVNISAKST